MQQIGFHVTTVEEEFLPSNLSPAYHVSLALNIQRVGINMLLCVFVLLLVLLGWRLRELCVCVPRNSACAVFQSCIKNVVHPEGNGKTCTHAHSTRTHTHSQKHRHTQHTNTDTHSPRPRHTQPQTQTISYKH